jgi:hypothetical protein
MLYATVLSYVMRDLGISPGWSFQLPQAYFWLGMTSGLPVIQPELSRWRETRKQTGRSHWHR